MTVHATVDQTKRPSYIGITLASQAKEAGSTPAGRSIPSGKPVPHHLNCPLDIPDTTGLDLGGKINFNPNGQLAGTNTLNTSFANLALSVDAVMDLPSLEIGALEVGTFGFDIINLGMGPTISKQG